MPALTTNTPEAICLMEKDWCPRYLIEAVSDLNHEVTGGAYEHVARSMIEQMLFMKVGRTIEEIPLHRHRHTKVGHAP